VIEDDGKTAAGIVEDFTSAGFAVDREITGPGGLRRAQTGNFDVIRSIACCPRWMGSRCSTGCAPRVSGRRCSC